MARRRHNHYEVIFCLSAAFLFLHLSSTVTADDEAVMTAFLSGLSSPPSGWSKSTPYCDWDGVDCDSSKRVTSINLDSMSLSGTVPAELNTLSELKTLYLRHNSFTGAFPSLSGLSSLQDARFDGNGFDSTPSGFLKGLTSLQTLSLTDNGDLAPWSLPADLTDSPSLVNIYAANASITGSLPDIFGSFPNLQDVRLSYNNLNGSLPDSMAESGIQNLWLNNQAAGLSGTIEVLSKMAQLSQVWLQKNQFTGPIPDLSGCVNLYDLQLRDNIFTGVVPASLMSLAGLQNVTLDNNKLQGPVPQFKSGVTATFDNNKFCLQTSGPCDPQVTVMLEIAGGFGYPVSLAESWGGNDACKGWSFVSCSVGNVVTITLGKKQFGGIISPAFANLTHLESLFLNDDNLTGPIPQSLTTLTNLKSLDVSNNNLTGPIPAFPKVKLNIANNPLLNKSIPDGGSPPGSSSAPPGGASSTKSISVGTIVGIVIAVIIFVSLLAFVLYKRYMNRKHKKFGRVGSPESGTQLVKNSIVGGNNVNGYGGVHSELASQSSGDHNDMPVFEGGNVSISIQVLRQVTDNFSENNILGRGGFGVVYKGELHDGTKIAVKRMESGAMGTKGMNEFQAEIAVLTKVRHRHLVALLGYCINGNERLLVYEYMPQGTLTEHLFDWRENGYPLTWKQRVSIALDVARGVEYLHSLAQQSFIHRDLKPSNILLGDDMRAKVADFGLVKNAPDGNYSLETRLAGTFGYLAPEYAATGRVTTKVDVYAFGVVLMEIITGRKALDDSVPDERAHLVSWFRRVLINNENIPKAIDQTLEPDEETMESIYKVCELAGHCTAREPFQRPDMGHAVNILGPLVEQWKPTRHEEEESDGINLNMSLPQALLRWQSDEGTSTMSNINSFSQTQSSIPSNIFASASGR